MSVETVYTLGHSSRTLEAFLALLADAGIRSLADVRRYPRSRRHPHFDADELAPVLAYHHVHYVHLPGLGGLRDEAPADISSFAALDDKWHSYAAHMDSFAFGAGKARLVRLAKKEAPVALMCAERDPTQCHRQLLSDHMVLLGFDVIHLLDPGTRQDHHRHPSARLEGSRLVYPIRQGSLFE